MIKKEKKTFLNSIRNHHVTQRTPSRNVRLFILSPTTRAIRASKTSFTYVHFLWGDCDPKFRTRARVRSHLDDSCSERCSLSRHESRVRGRLVVSVHFLWGDCDPIFRTRARVRSHLDDSCTPIWHRFVFTRAIRASQTSVTYFARDRLGIYRNSEKLPIKPIIT